MAWLERQPWPGNVRQLEHAIERAAVLCDKAILEPDDLTTASSPRPSDKDVRGEAGNEVTLRDAVEAAERQAIRAALDATAGNRRGAAERLGVSLRTLFYKMERYDIT